ncbi:DegT/DnrJ/EryC1/StrS family aminotransferase [Helicobacter cappadocius]|uniref:DegT/DnrJ/EryC1/StrS family aminotransferase n=1 Tax=Helicobacter cappadocius TaxID=3063998 RepID=A0AA90T9W4_9HELI|nr:MULTISPECIES: DegT/DnrJ/EryC1/StrS family aminotransferase [unclassified Helicobacter]MDO7253284.1 DegT/DnrJ/EryC1/StrS family aminotransferase [Helicobacter sp. faydin-H75]MDP2539287.1 DegT/DnrJ/EryC1/StrS family aminotransferase [Helicobacter sp. faydin-H76]
MDRINVNKPYLPDMDRYKKYLDRIWKNHHLTNFGPLSIELEEKLCEYLGVDNLLLVSNGTLALQIAYKVLDIKGEVITTPFSFAATTNTLLWEGLKPIFCDIDSETFCIDEQKIEPLITSATEAILPVHVFGNPCEAESIDKISKKHNLKIIYDAAHAFGVKYKNKSVFNYGDISTLSFHATKLFHCIEGGALIAKDKELIAKAKKIINFGLSNSFPELLGINAKNSEFHAAMGLCILEDMDIIFQERQKIWEYYYKELKDFFCVQKISKYANNNFHYFPILLENEEKLLNVLKTLEAKNIFPRRYFYPALNTLRFNLVHQDCPIAEDISNRILCLPIYMGLSQKDQDKIIEGLKF